MGWEKATVRLLFENRVPRPRGLTGKCEERRIWLEEDSDPFDCGHAVLEEVTGLSHVQEEVKMWICNWCKRAGWRDMRVSSTELWS